MSGKPFLDSNIILYQLSADKTKADRALSLLAAGGTVSVQVLNEIASVALRKLDLAWTDITEIITAVRVNCQVVPLTIGTHERGLALAQRYRLPVYDAMIAAAALEAGSTTLYSEDFHPGLRFDQRLTVRNPFR